MPLEINAALFMVLVASFDLSRKSEVTCPLLSSAVGYSFILVLLFFASCAF
jgi:hypothetical protein